MTSVASEQVPQTASPQTAQCFHCKSVQEVKDGEVVRTENNRLRLAGSCKACGSKVSKFIPNPDSPKQAEKSPSISPAGATKKIQKKKSKKQVLKKCAQCACAQHTAAIEAQPKKERKVTTPKKKDLDSLRERLESVEKCLSIRDAIKECIGEPASQEDAPMEQDIGLTAE